MSMRKFWAMLILILSASAITQAEVIVTISGPDDTKDSYVDGGSLYANTNYGSETHMYIGGGQTSPYCPVIQFDLSDIRSLYPNYRVTSAALRVRRSKDLSQNHLYTVDLRALNSSWIESEVTYNSRSTGVRWAGNGGDGNILSTDSEGDYINFSETSLGTMQMYTGNYYDAGIYTYNTTTLKDYYNDVLQGNVTDNGLIMCITNGVYYGTSVQLGSSESGGADYRPSLTLTLSEVPEPATVALLLVGGCPMLMYRRLRKNRG